MDNAPLVEYLKIGQGLEVSHGDNGEVTARAQAQAAAAAGRT